MRVRPEPGQLATNPIKTSRGRTARTRAAFAGLAVLAASIAGVAAAGTAEAASNATATTSFTAYPVAGNHGTWANANFSRSATVTFVSVDPTVSDCGANATSCFEYSGSIGDGGTFTAISGAKSPQAGVSITGTPSGTFGGSVDVTFFSSSDTASTTGVPASVSGAGQVSAADWFEQFFAAGTTFGSGPKVNSSGYAYATSGTCGNWVDTSSNGGGSSSADGDITGVNHCRSATGAISTFVNHSASCLDNSGFKWANGNLEQIWKCGAAGGEDQNFRLATYNGAEVLQSVAPTSVSSSPWCVTAPGGTGRLTISACTGTGGQVVKKEGAHYVFTGTGDVMDLKAASTANGNAVIAYPQNGGKNQQWSLP